MYRPQAVASVYLNKERMRKLRNTKAYKDELHRVKALNPTCHYCGDPTFTIHHQEDTMYKTDKEYIDAIKSGIPICRHCHYAGHAGWERCECGKGWRKPGSDYCHKCYPLELKEEREKSKRFWEKIQKEIRQENYRKFKSSRKRQSKR